MFSVSPITLFKIQFGPTVNAIGRIGKGASEAVSLKPVDLPIHWHKPQSNTYLFSLLSWHTRISEFCGRDKEIELLTEWVHSPLNVSIKFVSGQGGVGKSRLAAEFAEILQEE